MLITVFIVVALLVALIALPVAAQSTAANAKLVWLAIGAICVIGIVLAYRLASGPSPLFL